MNSEPSDRIKLLQQDTDFTVAVGPFVSVPRMGDCPSDSDVPFFRPSGSEPVSSPKGVLEETVVVEAWKIPPMGPRPYRVL